MCLEQHHVACQAAGTCRFFLIKPLCHCLSIDLGMWGFLEPAKKVHQVLYRVAFWISVAVIIIHKLFCFQKVKILSRMLKFFTLDISSSKQ